MTTLQIAITVFASTRNLQTSKQTPYSSEVQQPRLTTATLCGRGQAD